MRLIGGIGRTNRASLQAKWRHRSTIGDIGGCTISDIGGCTIDDIGGCTIDDTGGCTMVQPYFILNTSYLILDCKAILCILIRY